MSQVGSALFLHLNASFWTLAPMAIVALIKPTGWGWLLLAVGALWGFGAAVAMIRTHESNAAYFGGNSVGYVLAMPAFAVALGLEPGWLRILAAFVFAFFNVSSFAALRRAIAASDRAILGE